MDLRMRSDGGQISSAMLSIFDCSIILLFVPIFDKVLYPFCRRCGVEPTLLKRMGTGYIFCVFAMLGASLLEIIRKGSPVIEEVPSNCSGEHSIIPMSAISIWWQSPQYLLVGLSEILTSVSAMDLYYTEAPDRMRSVCQSINLLTTTLGYIVAGTINSLMSSWIPGDLNEGRLEYVYLVMAILMIFNAAAFISTSRSFRYKTKVLDEHAGHSL